MELRRDSARVGNVDLIFSYNPLKIFVSSNFSAGYANFDSGMIRLMYVDGSYGGAFAGTLLIVPRPEHNIADLAKAAGHDPEKMSIDVAALQHFLPTDLTLKRIFADIMYLE